MLSFFYFYWLFYSCLRVPNTSFLGTPNNFPSSFTGAPNDASFLLGSNKGPSCFLDPVKRVAPKDPLLSAKKDASLSAFLTYTMAGDFENFLSFIETSGISY